MPVFISYSHDDSEFVEMLARQLVLQQVKVWIDKWELRAGDSLMDRIASAIEGANALLIILSKKSVKSEWCRKELNAGLVRELNEKKVVVVPVLVEKCKIPLFLQDKLYADFTKDFDVGLQAVLDAIAHITTPSLGRIEKPKWHVDWSIEHGLLEGRLLITLTMVEQAKGKPFTCLTEVTLLSNRVGTYRYLQFLNEGLEWWEIGALVCGLAEIASTQKIQMLLKDELRAEKWVDLVDEQRGGKLEVHIVSRRLGEATGRDLLLDIGNQLMDICKAQAAAYGPTAESDFERLQAIQQKLDG